MTDLLRIRLKQHCIQPLKLRNCGVEEPLHIFQLADLRAEMPPCLVVTHIPRDFQAQEHASLPGFEKVMAEQPESDVNSAFHKHSQILDKDSGGNIFQLSTRTCLKTCLARFLWSHGKVERLISGAEKGLYLQFEGI
jgi:hypothetical protein